MWGKSYSKYNAKKTEVDGIMFASKKEAHRYIELRIMQKMGKISQLKLQPKYELQEKFKIGEISYRAINYVGDFEYIENGKLVVEDVKGVETKEFRLKAKMFRYKYPEIDFRVIH